jgi:hypothetical protein
MAKRLEGVEIGVKVVDQREDETIGKSIYSVYILLLFDRVENSTCWQDNKLHFLV